jgi:hypothetical protein
MINRLVVVAPVLVLSSVITGGVDAQAPLMVSVTYWKRSSCGEPAAAAKAAPVTAGTLRIQDGTGATVTVPLGPTPVPITIAAQPLTATLLLETPRVKLVSGASSSTPVTIDLSPAVVQGRNATFSMYLREDDRNGSINALRELERAAEFAEQANGAPMPLLTAHVLDGPGAPDVSHYDSPAKINIVGVTGRDDRWEPVVMVHEYAHLVMEHLAPGGPSGGEYLTEKSYPQRPDLAWTEGFSWAFAGLVTKPEMLGVMLYRCNPFMSFVDKPARPRLAPEDARYAQYNETRVGAATYHLVEYLGGGVPGFKRLLDGMKNYRRDGHSAWTARDLRDLAVQAFETTAADHAAIDDVFGDQGLSWLQGFAVGIDPTGARFETRAAVEEIVLSVRGPGGFSCRATRDLDGTTLVTLDDGRGVALGEKAADGPLMYSKNDDCYLVSGDGVVSTPDFHGMGAEHVMVPFPFLSAQAHWTGSYTVTAKYVCDHNQAIGNRSQLRCPSTFDAIIIPVNHSRTGTKVPIPVKLVRGVETQVATFRANGECTVLTNIDCGF